MEPVLEDGRMARCEASLAGLSVGDALGAQFFVPGHDPADPDAGWLPSAPWPWTDDTEMAGSVVAELRRIGRIERDALVVAFADRCDSYRGYGPGTVVLLQQVRDGVPWRQAAGESFGGQGSCGNGAAMRVAPLGAFFADDPERVVVEAVRSAEVTHAHPEGIAGAVAVALAAAYAVRWSVGGGGGGDLLAVVRDLLDAGEVRDGIERAERLLGRDAAEAAYELGNGARVTAQDTVPFCLWVAATFGDDYEHAIRCCIQAGGDVDTTAAIVGGIVASRTGMAGVPDAWLAAREPLPAWTTP